MRAATRAIAATFLDLAGERLTRAFLENTVDHLVKVMAEAFGRSRPPAMNQVGQ